MVHAYNSTYRRYVKFIETESRMVVARGWGTKEWGGLLINGDRVSVSRDEKSSGDGSTTV